MTSYIIRRLIQAVVVLIIVSIIVFAAMRLLPGDPLTIYIIQKDISALTPESEALLRHEFGLDKPLVMQYLDWMAGLLHGDFGKSIFLGDSVGTLLAQRLPVTIHLGLLSLAFSSVVGIAFGMLAALKRGKTLDNIISVLANIGIAAPSFWFGILLIYGFGLLLGWLPISGYTSPFDDFWLSTRQLILPVFVLATFSMASTVRQTRSSMLEVVLQDYVRTAWAKGLQERVIVIRHVLKNGLIPVITLIGTQVSSILGGAVLVENVFAIPGMGRLMVSAVFGQDYQVVQAGILVTGAFVVVVNLIVDISYGWLDPRIRY
jgi:peptide/nickel transport system permease protein